MKEKEIKSEKLVFNKKKIECDLDAISSYKNKFLLKQYSHAISVGLLLSSTVYASYKNKMIPFIDILGSGLERLSCRINLMQRMLNKIPFHNRIYWENPVNIIMTLPNVGCLATLGSIFGLPYLLNQAIQLPKLNSAEVNALIREEDSYLEYFKLYTNISVDSLDIIEFLMSMQSTDHKVNLSKKQKESFKKELNKLYEVSELQYNLDYLGDLNKLEKLEKCLGEFKVNESDLFFEENKTANETFKTITVIIKKLFEALNKENIMSKIHPLEQLKIKQQKLKHILFQNNLNQEERIDLNYLDQEERIDLNYLDQEMLNKFIEIDNDNIESDLKKTNYVVKKLTEELKDIYDLQKQLMEALEQLKNPREELFEESWEKITPNQQKELLKQIVSSKEGEKLSPYIITKLVQDGEVTSLYTEKKTENYIKTKYKNNLQSSCLYLIKSVLPGHKIHEEIKKQRDDFEVKQLEHGLVYDLKIISKLPTTALKEQYYQKRFQSYTITDYKQSLAMIKELDILTFSVLIKSKIFQEFVINNLDTFDVEKILKLEIHSPFLLDLVEFYACKFKQNCKGNERKINQISGLEKFLEKFLIYLQLKKEEHYPMEILIALEKYVSLYPDKNNQVISDHIKKLGKEFFWLYCDFLNTVEDIKKYFVVPSKNNKNK